MEKVLPEFNASWPTLSLSTFDDAFSVLNAEFGNLSRVIRIINTYSTSGSVKGDNLLVTALKVRLKKRAEDKREECGRG